MPLRFLMPKRQSDADEGRTSPGAWHNASNDGPIVELIFTNHITVERSIRVRKLLQIIRSMMNPDVTEFLTGISDEMKLQKTFRVQFLQLPDESAPFVVIKISGHENPDGPAQARRSRHTGHRREIAAVLDDPK